MGNRTKRSPLKMRDALRVLRETGSVSRAAQSVGIGRSTLYAWRGADTDFAHAFEDALAAYADALEIEADRRGVEGVEKGVYYQGQRVDSVRDYSDTLLMFRLKALKPKIYREKTKADPQTASIKRIEREIIDPEN